MINPRRKTGLQAASGHPMAWLATFAVFMAYGSGMHAGDILRGGISASASRKNAEARMQAGAEAARLTKVNAQDRLARTTQVISAMRAMQQNARSALITGVPDGLQMGGLEMAGGANARWDGADLPQETTSGSNKQVTIQQNAEQAVLHWQTFNVGSKTALNFNQSAGGSDASKWVVFNKVFDPSGTPSRILGSINASGQVYVLNQNGIIFSGGSQVNARALVASALPINDNLIERGLLNNPDAQFLFSALPIAAGSKGTPAFTPPAPLTADGRVGNVVVEEGATISAAETSENTGGRVMLVGANVTNRGTISTPSGQAILAAGLQVGVVAYAKDTSLRGLDVFVGDVGSYGGTASNSGLIESYRGNAIMAGKSVQQMGVIDSSTSVSLNGRIDLLASYDAVSNTSYDATNTNDLPFFFFSTGDVTVGAGSVTRILPEWDSRDKITGTQLALRSQINMQGNTVYVAPGGMIQAPSGNVSLSAGKWFVDTGAKTNPFVYTGGQVYIDSGAFIDVAGSTDIYVSLSQSILTLELRGAEFADSPLQRDNMTVRGVPITIDVRRQGAFAGKAWIGTPLGDASGFVGLIERTVGQLSVAGGTVNLQAGNSVVVQRDAVIDVSGGWVVHEAGKVQTTRLTSGARIMDIWNATPDINYDGIVSATSMRMSRKWGVLEQFSLPLAPLGGYYQQQYIEGADAGRLSIIAPSMALDGDMRSNTVIGPRQLRQTSTSSNLPDAGVLEILFKAQDPGFGATFPYYSPTPPTVVFSSGYTFAPVGAFALGPGGEPLALSADRIATVVLSPELLKKKGFGSITVENSDGNISVPSGVKLEAPQGGSIVLKGANVDIQGMITAPGGILDFTAYSFTPYRVDGFALATSPSPVPGRGNFILGGAGILSAEGLIVDDRVTAPLGTPQPMKPNAGKVSIAAYNVDLAQGSKVDVSGGFTISALRRQAYGNGGEIIILAGQDPGPDYSILGGKLSLNADLLGFSGAMGGSLSITAPFIQVGGSARQADTFLVQPEFFNEGGFSGFTLTGIGAATGVADEYVPAVVIASGTLLEPVIESRVARTTEGKQITLKPVTRPLGVRPPVSLAFNAPGVAGKRPGDFSVMVRGDIVMEGSATIQTEPLAEVSFNGQTINMQGRVIAPGGAISLTAGRFPSNDSAPTFALPTIYIGSQALLSTAGTVVYTPDPFGRRRGTVLPGGTISLKGNILAEVGAVLDVSGTSGIMDLTPGELGLLLAPEVPATSGVNTARFSVQSTPMTLDSDGGTISFSGTEMLISNATLIGRAGGPSALGGNLEVNSNRFYENNVAKTSADINLIVTQNRQALPNAAFPRGVGIPVRDDSGTILTGMGYFAVEDFQRGGFDALTLGRNIQFQRGVDDPNNLGSNVQFVGPVTINAARELRIATGGIILADSAVTLSAPYVALGQPFIMPGLAQELQQEWPFKQTPSTGSPTQFKPEATFGPGSLTVRARLIDVGNLVLQNIGRADLSAFNGDIRGGGTLSIAGDLTLNAGQVYPATALTFNIFAYDHGGIPGSVTITAAGSRNLPLSGGGILNIYGSIINQGGVLRAPMGSINLGWDGSGTTPVNPAAGGTGSGLVAVPATQQLTLGAGSITSVSAVDPSTGQELNIPYGMSPDGITWIDPTGLDISASGPPAKKITLSARNLTTENGSLIDISGGGDLFAYRWESGKGGSKDILASSSSFAVIPGYGDFFAPYASFNTSSAATNLQSDPGYVNSGLSVGDHVYLGASEGLPAGVYTLLPARYALMPGAFLVTPQSDSPVGTFQKADGSSIVSGYRYNSLNSQRTVSTRYARFEVLSSDVVNTRSQYHLYSANDFFPLSASSLDVATPRLPQDAGQLVLQATDTMRLSGSISASAGRAGRGAFTDISSPVDILISDGSITSLPGTLVLNAADLTGFSASSLLIGGVRSTGTEGVSVEARTNSILVDNGGTTLASPEIILVSKGQLNVATEATIESSGSLSNAADRLLFNGNGTLLRVSGDSSAEILRTGVTASAVPSMTIGANARISGRSIILDSSSATSLDSSAQLLGTAISLNSGQVSVLLNNPGALQPTTGLVLSGNALLSLWQAQSVSLLSYSSIDFYGTGIFGSSNMSNLFLRGGVVRGFNQGAGSVELFADNIFMDNAHGGQALAFIGAPSGTLALNAEIIHMGTNQIGFGQYANLALNAGNGVLAEGTGGLSTQGALTITTPMIATGKAAVQAMTAGGAFAMQKPVGGGTSTLIGGLGGNLTLTGASMAANSDIFLPSGQLTLRATGGNLSVGGTLSVEGTEQGFYDLVKYTDAGEVTLTSDTGNVTVDAGGRILAGAHSGGGNGGKLVINAGTGTVSVLGTLAAQGGAGGKTGTFTLDTGTLSSFSALASVLNAAGFNESRSFRVRNGSVLVDGTSKARNFNLSTDQGSITVSGTIDASEETGGAIHLAANESVILEAGSLLTVAGQKFSSAGTGGMVTIEAGTQRNGVASSTAVLDIRNLSTIDLSVAEKTPMSAFYGQFSGKLHLRAPQTTTNTDIQMNAIDGSIVDTSSILVEGYEIFDLTASGGSITTTVQNNIRSHGQTFMGTAGTTTGGYTAMINRLLTNNGSLLPVFVLAPGAEIINRNGDLTLGTTSSTATSDWNLASGSGSTAFRFGPKSAPGVLTMRASGDLVFYNALSDGFTATGSTGTSLWLATLSSLNTLLPVNTQSWSYRMAAGADMTAADFHQVQSVNALAANKGSLLLGKDYGAATFVSGTNALTSTALTNRWQAIRTGTGNIDISAGRDVRLLNQFATIYTAGVRVPDFTSIFAPNDFVVPIINRTPNQGSLSIAQQQYAPQYSMAGGHVNVAVQVDIGHYTKDNAGNLIADSSRQLPTNWLYRRGVINPITGDYGTAGVTNAGAQGVNDAAASTTWWIDFSNFFEGIGALGGGNVSLIAGRDVANVDAVVPTNARAPRGTPDPDLLHELGGGDLVVRAGRNIDGGVYYVERGTGDLFAGNSITTNSTRSPSKGIIDSLTAPTVRDSNTWLPTVLFAGKSSFTVGARGDILLGPTANPFLLPQGLNNRYWYKTYFSTYSPDSVVDVTSLGGDISYRFSVTVSEEANTVPVLQEWMRVQNLFTTTANTGSANNYPWIRLVETDIAPFTTSFSLTAPTLRSTAFSGDINITGDVNLFPASLGTIDMVAAGAINGLHPTGLGAQNLINWSAARINLSDADPASLPGITTPFSYKNLVGTTPGVQNITQTTFLDFIRAAFNESGSFIGSFGSAQVKQALHAPGLLHANDPDPLRLYALSGNIGSVTLFSAKEAKVIADRDVTDIAFYIQNTKADDISVVASGRDIVAYNANAPLRAASIAGGNRLAESQSVLAGDIQISGPGALEVLAGRNLDLGVGGNNTDGTGVGITSAGNSRNPYLPFEGADIIAGAGIGLANGLEGSQLDFNAFIDGLDNIEEYLSELDADAGIASLNALPLAQRDRLALQIFFLVLRDAGREQLESGAGYEKGFEAIDTLFAQSTSQGDINTRSRDIRTKSGGYINIFAPSGKLTLASSILGSPLAPPGIVTESGGRVSIFTKGNVDIGLARIFTLKGGDVVIWSSEGDIAAGSASKTVQSAPPTRVVIDPQTGDVQTDLAGLATGGGIGVLATVEGVDAGSVDLIAPQGSVDAGDAGIRASGNINIAAVQILNADNISASGTTAGVPTTAAVAAPNIAGLSSASSSTGATSSAADQVANQARQNPDEAQEAPSTITVEVLGYGGTEGDDEEDDQTVSSG